MLRRWQPEQQDPTLLLNNNLSLPRGSRSHRAASSRTPYQLLEAAARGIPKAIILDQKPPDPHQPLARAVQALTHCWQSPRGVHCRMDWGLAVLSAQGTISLSGFLCCRHREGTDLCLGALCAVTVSIFNHGN